MVAGTLAGGAVGVATVATAVLGVVVGSGVVVTGIAVTGVVASGTVAAGGIATGTVVFVGLAGSVVTGALLVAGYVTALRRHRRLLDRVRAARGELAYQARHDPLTGLANRAMFSELLAARVAAARRDSRSLGLLYCNLDDVAVVNDGLGHAAGDHLLRVAAQRLRHCARTTDLVARLGGDEFAVILRGSGYGELGRGELATVADRLIAAFQQPTTIAGYRRSVRASAGLAFADGAGTDTPDLLLRRARSAMHEAKRTGKNRLVVYRPGMVPVAGPHLADALATALRHGADSAGFDVHYQPIVRLDDGALVALEALARWTEPGRGPVPPGEFVAVAEDGGLVAALDDLVLTRACHEIQREFPEFGVRLHVNVSATRLTDRSLPASVAAALAGSGLDPRRLVVEVTETGRIVDLDRAAEVLDQIRRLGAAVALDDVGAGFSTIAALHRLPVDVVKLDRTLVARPMDGSRVAALRRSMIDVAHAIGAVVIAEGIEHHRQLADLALLGCELGQGFLFARPAPLAELAAASAGPAGATRWWPVGTMTAARPA